MHAHEAIALYKTGIYLDEAKEEKSAVYKRGCRQPEISLRASQKSTKPFCGTPKRIGRPQSHIIATSIRASRSAMVHGTCSLESQHRCAERRQHLFLPQMWHACDRRRGSRILSQRRGLEPGKVALYRALPDGNRRGRNLLDHDGAHRQPH